MKHLWYPNPQHIPVVGHRGICAKYPENTLVSFAAAIELGVNLIEFDVNVTKDNQLVVIHDNTIDRTSNGAGLTRDYTLAELKKFDFGSHFSPAFQGAQIPTLREVLDLVMKAPDTLLLNVEIKDYTPECVDMTIAMLTEYGLTERVVIACFDAQVLRYVQENYPQYRTQGFPARNMKRHDERIYDHMFGMGIPIRTNDAQLQEDIAFAKSKGILAWLYIADTVESVQRCVDFGCDNITGNNPGVALKYLHSKGLHK